MTEDFTISPLLLWFVPVCCCKLRRVLSFSCYERTYLTTITRIYPSNSVLYTSFLEHGPRILASQPQPYTPTPYHTIPYTRTNIAAHRPSSRHIVHAPSPPHRIPHTPSHPALPALAYSLAIPLVSAFAFLLSLSLCRPRVLLIPLALGHSACSCSCFLLYCSWSTYR